MCPSRCFTSGAVSAAGVARLTVVADLCSRRNADPVASRRSCASSWGSRRRPFSTRRSEKAGDCGCPSFLRHPRRVDAGLTLRQIANCHSLAEWRSRSDVVFCWNCDRASRGCASGRVFRLPLRTRPERARASSARFGLGLRHNTAAAVLGGKLLEGLAALWPPSPLRLLVALLGDEELDRRGAERRPAHHHHVGEV